MAETYTPKEVMKAARAFKAPESKEREEATVPVRDETGGFIGLSKEVTGTEYVQLDKFTKTPEDGTVLYLEKGDDFKISYEAGSVTHENLRVPGAAHLKRLRIDEARELVTQGREVEDMRGYLPDETLEKLGIPPIEG